MESATHLGVATEPTSYTEWSAPAPLPIPAACPPPRAVFPPGLALWD